MPSPDEEKTEVRIDADGEVFPCLEIISGPRGGSGRFPLKTGKNSIGRSRENDIVLDDSSVSRRHAVVELSPDGAILADLGSRNGTRVSGQKIDQPVPLQHEARLKIGLFLLRYLTAEASPVKVEQLPAEEIPPDKEDEEEPPPQSPPVEEISGPPRSRKGILYLVLGAVLIVALVQGGPQLLKIFGVKKKASPRATERPGKMGQVLTAEKVTLPSNPPGIQPVFLDFSSSPIPAQIFFGSQQVGVTPLRISTNLADGKWYEARGLFQLPEIGEVVEEKVPFTRSQGASVIPLSLAAKIGIFKVAALPRDAQLYLEGYFEKDPYRAKPIKFAEIVFGKPIYVPYGRYVLELRQSRQLGGSQTYIDEVVYRREFFINGSQTTFTVDVNDEALKLFPVQLTSIPPGAKVFIDDKEVGQTPYSGTFPVGQHLMTMKREGYFDYVQMIKMEINMPYLSEVPLKTSEAGELINRADLLMKEDRFAEALPVLVDAFSKKPTPLETAEISYRVGLCYLRQKSYKEAQDYFLKAMEQDNYKYAGKLGLASLNFEQGDTKKALQLLVEVLSGAEDPKIRSDAAALFQRVSPLKSVMYIASDPSGALVLVNGNEVTEKTPMIVNDVGVGSYTIQFRKEGYEASEVKINIGVSEFRPVVVKLKKSGT